MEEYTNVLKALASNSKESKQLLKILDAELALPNIPFPTMGGEVFWSTLAEFNGWKLQQNMFTHHARILNSEDVRIAWGTINGMMKAMDRMSTCLNKYEENRHSSNESIKAMQELKQLKELLDIGAITETEYETKKKILMNKF